VHGEPGRQLVLQEPHRRPVEEKFQAGGGLPAGCYALLMKKSLLPSAQGPFRADQLRSGDPYELSNGHPVHCLPTGGRGAKAANVGGGVLASDPAVQDVGVDTGFSPSPEILRAPDLSVGEIPDTPGWVQGAPPLAVEYADTGQDEADLQIKIKELFAGGTRYLWVVRLTGPRRVEVHQPGQEMRIVNPGVQLTAPGILANPVPVEALYDREVARRVTFRNLLQRQGYASLEDVRTEGEALGRATGEVEALRTAVIEVLAARGFAVDDGLRTALASFEDPAALSSILRRAAVAASPAEILLP
jgi:Uma2 family endonuclease